MRAALSGVIILGLVISTTVPLPAQTEIAKILVGKWEGRALFPHQKGHRPDPDRTLVVRSVREQEGRWIVEADYGITGKNLKPVDVSLKVSGQEAVLEFRGPADEEVKLTLEKGEFLDGTVFQAKGKAKGLPAPLRLKRVR